MANETLRMDLATACGAVENVTGNGEPLSLTIALRESEENARIV